MPTVPLTASGKAIGNRASGRWTTPATPYRHSLSQLPQRPGGGRSHPASFNESRLLRSTAAGRPAHKDHRISRHERQGQRALHSARVGFRSTFEIVLVRLLFRRGKVEQQFDLTRRTRERLNGYIGQIVHPQQEIPCNSWRCLIAACFLSLTRAYGQPIRRELLIDAWNRRQSSIPAFRFPGRASTTKGRPLPIAGHLACRYADDTNRWDEKRWARFEQNR